MKATIVPQRGGSMKQEYVRKGHVISDMKGEVVFTGTYGKNFASTNAAKRKSRELQGDNLGCGILRVVS